MIRHILQLCIYLAFLTPSFAAETKGWTELKKGMTPNEALVALGKPLIETKGHGFDVWIYDSKAEVVFHQGPIMAWTIPTPNPVSEARPIEMDLPLGTPKRLPHFVLPKSDQNPAVQDSKSPQSTQFRYKLRN